MRLFNNRVCFFKVEEINVNCSFCLLGCSVKINYWDFPGYSSFKKTVKYDLKRFLNSVLIYLGVINSRANIWVIGRPG